MTSLESIEKLRESLNACTQKAGVDSDQFDTYWITARACDVLIDEIEREISERYMELPLDRDGVPIRIGDLLECSEYGNQTERFTVYGYTTEYSTWTGDIATLMATNENSTEFYCDRCRHIELRTVEDVLRDCCNEWNQHCGEDWEQGVYAKYAAELQMREGGA